MKKKMKQEIVFVFLFLFVIAILWVGFNTLNTTTGKSIHLATPDLSIFEVEELDEGARYLLLVQNKGEGDAYNVQYGYRTGDFYESVGEYGIIRSGEILTFTLENPTEQPLQEFKVDIDKWDDGTSKGFIEEENELDNVALLCIDRDGDGFYKHGILCNPVDCNDGDFSIKACEE